MKMRMIKMRMRVNMKMGVIKMRMMMGRLLPPYQKRYDVAQPHDEDISTRGP